MTQNPSMPETEAAHLTKAYQGARVILEYGSGGSTRIAAQMPGKYVMSVESDRDWARSLRREIAAAVPLSPVIVHHVDIGATAAWGRVVDESGWRHYHRYPNGIWDEPFFRHPDVVLIDGRFRVACLMTVLLRIQRPVRVLFDDYADRPKYQRSEALVRPRRMIGRMAEFEIDPGMIRPRDIGFVIGRYFEVTVHHANQKTDYALSPKDMTELNRIASDNQERQADDRQA
ncbi:hypothetical protein [Thiothrix eikelboomii]|jgi:hypothetical protein|uniref:hypothetical protein n=1 Tax=Thiothrix eikelboomii TaxID=92487 RepID=UPI003BAE7D25